MARDLLAIAGGAGLTIHASLAGAPIGQEAQPAADRRTCKAVEAMTTARRFTPAGFDRCNFNVYSLRIEDTREGRREPVGASQMRTILWILGFTAAAVFIGIFVTVAFGLPAFKVASPYIACGIIGLYIVLRIIPRHMQR